MFRGPRKLYLRRDVALPEDCRDCGKIAVIVIHALDFAFAILRSSQSSLPLHSTVLPIPLLFQVLEITAAQVCNCDYFVTFHGIRLS
jgi:hypothetical protein